MHEDLACVVWGLSVCFMHEDLACVVWGLSVCFMHEDLVPLYDIHNYIASFWYNY